MALSTSTNWIANFIVAFITPPLFSAAGGGYYFLLVGFCLISVVFVYVVYRETAGKTLEQLGEVFGDGGVEVELQAESGVRQAASGGEGTLEGINGKAIVAEPLDMPVGEENVESSSSSSSETCSVSAPLLIMKGGTQEGLIDIPLDDDHEE